MRVFLFIILLFLPLRFCVAIVYSENISAKFSAGLTFKVKDSSYPLSSEEIKNWFREEGELRYVQQYRSEIENINYCAYKKSILCELLLDAKKENRIKKISSFTLDTNKANQFFDDIARQINKDPISAKIQFEEGKVLLFSLSSNGVALDKKKSMEIFSENLTKTQSSSEIELAYREIPPEVPQDSIENLGITTLLGEGKSNFRGSPKNRIFNIKVATNRFDGVIIKPGEEFSFVKILGEVDKEHGYLPELVIKKDKTEPEFGGGICQVSTTVFRAAIYSGLEITARKNHAYPVQYYNPQGMDATIYVPRPDLRFVNNTPGHILIQTKIEGMELIFQFYGTSDGRTTKVIGPDILEKKHDGSMKTTFIQQVMDKNRSVIREDVFNSNYDSPSKYPHPGSIIGVFTKKPKDWSDREWKEYKKDQVIQ